MGWNPGKDITLVIGADKLDDFLDGSTHQADAIIPDDQVTYMALKEGYKPLVDMAEWKVPMPAAGVNVDYAWLQDNRETARRLVKSMVEAIAMMKKDKQVVY